MFFTRLLSSVVLVLISLVTLVAGGGLLAAVLLFISAAAFLELTKAMGVHEEKNRINALEITGLVFIFAYYTGCYFYPGEKMTLFALITSFMGMLFVYVVTFPKFQIRQVVVSCFSFVYAPVMLSFIFLTRSLDYGKYIVWLILISAWGCDTCAYVVGMLFGKTVGNHKIFPKLSPKKSLEGCIAGVIGAAGLGALYGYFIAGRTVTGRSAVWMPALICGVGAVFSQMGDLAASAIKRNHGIKDYGKLIPGHGGIMDRFDSVTVTAPLIYFLTQILMGF